MGGKLVGGCGSGVRGEACSFVACLSHLTIDHASLSRRGTAPTPNINLQHLGAHYASSIYYTEIVYLSYPLAISPSVAIIYLLG